MPSKLNIAVVGARGDEWGETVVAAIASEDGADITLDDVRHYAESCLARYKLPRWCELSERVLRNPTGKREKLGFARWWKGVGTRDRAFA